MFGGRTRRSSKVRIMQLFHEIKQQFPTVPDHLITSCISLNSTPTKEQSVQELLKAIAALENIQTDLMGRSASQLQTPSTIASDTDSDFVEINKPLDDKKLQQLEEEVEANSAEHLIETRSEMNDSGLQNVESVKCNNFNNNNDSVVQNKVPQRPSGLDVKPQFSNSFNNNINNENDNNNSLRSIQLSKKCHDVFKLVNSNVISDKPPKSPLSSSKRFGGSSKNSPTKCDKTFLTRPTKSEPNSPLTNISNLTLKNDFRQSSVDAITTNDNNNIKPTTDTATQLTNNFLAEGAGVNFSVNVNCSVDILPSPSSSSSRATSQIQLTPQQPWLVEPVSQRNYTSVNLTLRPPSSEPQPPIDITSKNSSLTYSTSSFDSQKGLQSRLQITVGPTGNSIASLRTRPRSSYLPQETARDIVPARAESLPDLAVKPETTVILKQEARIERMRIELNTEKAKLVIMQKEVTDLEKNNVIAIEHKTDAELEKQLQLEIRHLRGQCERLAKEVDKILDNQDFYDNIYTGQRGPLLSDIPPTPPIRRNRLEYDERSALRVIQSDVRERSALRLIQSSDVEGPKWNCHMCTFLNHPDLDKCEQCEMPKILHGMNNSDSSNINNIAANMSQMLVNL